MPDFSTNLLSEIEFAKKHFEFIEITLEPNLTKYTPDYIQKIRAKLGAFKAIGHIHWHISPKDFNKFAKSIEIYSKLGIRKITFHPAKSGENFNINETFRYIAKALKLCEKLHIILRVENLPKPPFNTVASLKPLFNRFNNLGLTLDIGHANRASKGELLRFLSTFSNRLRHIHLHNNFGSADHLPFSLSELKSVTRRIGKLKKNITVTLEIFSILREGGAIPVSFQTRRDLLIEQLKMVKSASRKAF